MNLTHIKTALAVALVLGAVAAPASAVSWTIDPAHSSADFVVRHMMVSNVRGSFGKMSGTVDYDPANLAATKIDATIDVTSVNTREEKRDAHLRSADFFDVEKHPTMKFVSKKVVASGSGRATVVGDLTLHGVTKEVTLEVEGPTPEVTDGRGNAKMGASATTKLNRKDFGLVWNRAVETGGVVVGDEVSVTLDLELNRKLPPK